MLVVHVFLSRILIIAGGLIVSGLIFMGYHLRKHLKSEEQHGRGSALLLLLLLLLLSTFLIGALLIIKHNS